MSDDKKELRELYNKLCAEKDAIVAAAAPHRARYNEIMVLIQPLEAEAREEAKKFRAIEQPRLAELCNQIGPLAVALGGKKFSAGPVEIKTAE